MYFLGHRPNDTKKKIKNKKHTLSLYFFPVFVSDKTKMESNLLPACQVPTNSSAGSLTVVQHRCRGLLVYVVRMGLYTPQQDSDRLCGALLICTPLTVGPRDDFVRSINQQ
jgi:hypothetical protein